MITLTRKLKKPSANSPNGASIRATIRDRLLVKEVQELEQNLPNTCKIHYPDPDVLSEFTLTISPDEGFWKDGKFKFSVNVPEEYNMMPPKVKCLTRLWHPNISVDGDICLSLLRQNSIDGMGWAPTRTIKDVVWGLNSLYTDLLNFDDPLNNEAAEMYLRDKKEFQYKAREFVTLFARK